MINSSDFNRIDLEKIELEKIKLKEGNYGERSGEKYIENGFIILDKPVGPTSHDVVNTVKLILGLAKAGHSGTLDPNVSGVLPIGLQNGTKILNWLSKSRKRYICNMSFNDNVDEKKIKDVLNEFTGQIYQFPPLESNVVRRLRKRTIYNIELLDVRGNDFLLDVECEAGTYIRTLCVDIGRVIGVKGYMKELRRISSAKFLEKDTITLHQLFDAFHDYKENGDMSGLKKIIRPIEDILDLPKMLIDSIGIKKFRNGGKIKNDQILGYENFHKDDFIQLFSVAEELIGIGIAIIDSDSLREKNSVEVIQPKKVI